MKTDNKKTMPPLWWLNPWKHAIANLRAAEAAIAEAALSDEIIGDHISRETELKNELDCANDTNLELKAELKDLREQVRSAKEILESKFMFDSGWSIDAAIRDIKEEIDEYKDKERKYIADIKAAEAKAGKPAKKGGRRG